MIESEESMALKLTLDPCRWLTGRLFSQRSLHQVQQTYFLTSAPVGRGEMILYLSQPFNADTLDRTVGSRRHIATVELAVRPVDIFSAGGSCKLAFTEELEGRLSPETKEAVENGVQSSYLQGIVEQDQFLFQVVLFQNEQGSRTVSSPASTFRSIAWLPFTWCLLTDPECQYGARNISSHGFRLRVPLHV